MQSPHSKTWDVGFAYLGSRRSDFPFDFASLDCARDRQDRPVAMRRESPRECASYANAGIGGSQRVMQAGVEADDMTIYTLIE